MFISDEDFNKLQTPKKIISDEEFSNMQTQQQEKKPGVLKTLGSALISSEKGFGESIGQAINVQTRNKEIEENNKRFMKAGQDMKKLALETTDPVKRQTYLNTAQQYFDKAGSGIQDVVGELKTSKQVIGEAAGVALDIATLGNYGQSVKAAKNFQRLKPLTNKVPSVVSEVASTGTKELGKKMIGGAALGGVYGTLGAMEEDAGLVDTAKSALIGAGVGAALPVAGMALGKTYKGAKTLVSGERKITKTIEKAEKELVNIENNYAKIRKASKYSDDKLAGSRRRILEANVLPGAVDETGTIRTVDAANKYRSQVLNGAEGVVRESLQKEGVSVSSDAIKSQLRKEVKSSGLEGKQLKRAYQNIDSEIDGLMMRAGETGNIPLTTLHDAKINSYKGINFQTDGWVKAEQKAIARAYKKVIEKYSSFNVREVNKELSKYYRDLDYLELLDGRKVKGGKLGKYAAQIAGNIGGAIAGGAVGGPGGSVLGTIIGGELASKVKGMMLSGAFGKPIGGVAPKSTILSKAVENANKAPLMIGQDRLNSVKSMAVNRPMTKDSNMLLSKDKSGKKSIINQLFPQEGKESPREVTKTILDKVKDRPVGLSIKDVSKSHKTGKKTLASKGVSSVKGIKSQKDQAQIGLEASKDYVLPGWIKFTNDLEKKIGTAKTLKIREKLINRLKEAKEITKSLEKNREPQSSLNKMMEFLKVRGFIK